MKEWLDSIRKPNKDIKISKKIIYSLLILLLGIILGVFSKWLDNLSIYDEILWQHILGILDLRNVFSYVGIWIFLAITISVFSKTPLRAGLNVFLFFVGMTVSYHLYTIMFSGFNPKSYMMIWYGITAITPILAFICWYAKGNNKISIIISSVILAVMLKESFSIGLWYFYFKSVIDTLLFLGTMTVLYTKPKNSIYSLLFAIVLTLIYSLRLYIIQITIRKGDVKFMNKARCRKIAQGKICQSCGMPITSSGQLGWEKDGSISEDYCKYCYKNGEFIDKVSMEEYIEMCSKYGEQAGMTNAEMKKHCEKLFPTLKRWKQNNL